MLFLTSLRGCRDDSRQPQLFDGQPPLARELRFQLH
jgi:hypothetical protein